MESIGQQHQGTCQDRDTERSPNLTINHLPDEVLLEIFDFHRQPIDPYDHLWREEYVRLDLAHVCRRWRAVMFASCSRLGLGITVGPQKPGHIKTILSSPLPIFIEYNCLQMAAEITGSALWRMHAALRHRDRVREIFFEGRAASFGQFINLRATNYHFPALESLYLGFPYGLELDIPATFLRGPDQSDLRLRRLGLDGASLASVSGLLLSATALTHLKLRLSGWDFKSSQGTFVLPFLQGMPSLRSLALITPYNPQPRYPQDEHSTCSTPKDIVPLLKLTSFHFDGSGIFLNNFMSGFLAPSLQDASFRFFTKFPLLYLASVIDDVREEFRSVSLTFEARYFRLFSSTYSGMIDHFNSSFKFDVHFQSNSTYSSPLSTKLAMTEELTLSFPRESLFSLRDFLRQFRSVRVLRVNPYILKGNYLQQDARGNILPIFPALEEIEVSVPRSTETSDEEYQCYAAEARATFEPFVTARERAGCLVKITIVCRHHTIRTELY